MAVCERVGAVYTVRKGAVVFLGPERRDPAGILTGSSAAMGPRTRVVEPETEAASAAFSVNTVWTPQAHQVQIGRNGAMQEGLRRYYETGRAKASMATC